MGSARVLLDSSGRVQTLRRKGFHPEAHRDHAGAKSLVVSIFSGSHHPWETTHGDIGPQVGTKVGVWPEGAEDSLRCRRRVRKLGQESPGLERGRAG